MNTRNRLVISILCLFAVVFCVVGLSACKGGKKECTHSFGEWTITKAATCTETGLRVHVCAECGEEEPSAIEALGHSWAEATCTAPKTCTVCAATEGSAAAHAFTEETVTDGARKTAATCESAAVYYKSCACGAVSNSDADTFVSGEALGHKDENTDHTCDNGCGKTDMGTHADGVTDADHVCDYGCGAVLEDCADAEGDGNHACDVCQKADVSAHRYSEPACMVAATCTECGLTHGAALEHIDADKNHICDYGCGKTAIGTHGDAADDDNHLCDYGCGAVLEDCADAGNDGDHACDICGKAGLNEHTYGDATCEAPATCTECGATTGKALGHKDENTDHVCDVCDGENVGTHADADDDTDHLCDYGCGAVLEDCADAEGDGNHACDVCQKADVSAHRYSEPACEVAATCTECGLTHGAALEHTDADKNHTCDYGCGKTGMGTHGDAADDADHLCDYGCKAVLEECADAEDDGNHACDICGKADVSDHTYNDATCSATATCNECGATTGSALPHAYVQETVKEGALKSEATCENGAVYYKSCICGAVSDSDADTFVSGSALSHVYDRETVKEGALKSEATCENAAVYYKSCVCGAVSDSDADTFPYGEASAHSYDREMAIEGALKSEATCESGAVYYKSCECGAVSDSAADTFVSGTALPHSHSMVGSTEATCHNPATKTYRCVCGDAYTETDGDALGHDITGVKATERLVDGCEYVMVYVCQRETCGEEVLGETVFHHTHIASITKAATCREDGVKTLTCACGDTKTEVIEKNATGHSWSKGTVTDGVRTDTCAHCSETKTVTVFEGTKTDATNANDLKDKEIELNDANISLDSGVIEAIGNKNVTVSADKLKPEELAGLGLTDTQLAQVGNNPVYNFTINDGTQNISQFGENNWVTITLPYTLEEGEDVDSIAVWFINDKGEPESIEATYNNGYVTFKTNHFSYYTVTRLTPAERCALYGHAYAHQHVKGSCIKDAYDLYVCVRCHHKYIDEKTFVKADGHDYECVTYEATCTEDGYLLYACTDCDYSYQTRLNATGHTYVVGDSKEATCSEDGYTKYVCEHGDASYVTVQGKAAHVCTATVVAPTCETAGYTLHSCDNCDYEYTDTFVAALGHAYGEGKWQWAEDNGSATLTFICENDGKHVLVLDANVGVTVVNGTCSNFVKTTYTAAISFNGEVYADEKIVEQGTPDHIFSSDWKNDEKSHWHECICGERADESAHDYTRVIENKAPTCSESGKRVTACVCGTTHTEILPATGDHTYVGGSCSSCGKEEATCDHTELHEVVLDMSELGVCDWDLYYFTCECGEFVKLDADRSGMTCNMKILENEEFVDEEGNRCMEVSGVCEDCGLEIHFIGKSEDEGCHHRMTMVYTFTMGDVVLLDNALVEESNENHDSATGESIKLSEYGVCGGFMDVFRCDSCGEIVEISRFQPTCPFDYDKEPEAEEIIGEDGVVHLIQKLVCPDCGLEVVAESWIENVSVCETVTHMIRTFRIGDTVIAEDYLKRFDDKHEYEREYELLGDSCRDGVTVIERCDVCGYYDSYTTYHHPDCDYEVEIDLSEHTPCGGYVLADVCKVCGEIADMYGEEFYCAFDKEHHQEIYDDNGNVIGFRNSRTCIMCRLTLTEENRTEYLPNCEYEECYGYYLYMGNTPVFSYERKWSGTSHNHEYTYELLGDSCEDGYFIHASCSACGESEVWKEYGHRINDLKINLEEHGVCGGMIYVNGCEVCGEIFGFNGGEFTCEGLEVTDDKFVDEDGNEHYTCTQVCSQCGLRFVEDTRYVYQSVCEFLECRSFALYVGETLIASGSEEYQCSGHQYEYVYTLLGDTCDDGYEVTYACTRCGDGGNSYIDYGHQTTWFELELPEGCCGGMIYGEHCTICDEIFRVEGMKITCYFGDELTYEEVTDENGILHLISNMTCQKCGLRVHLDEWKIEESACSVRSYDYNEIYFGDELLICFTTESFISTHDYETTYKMDGKACEDGYYMCRTCKTCGEYEEIYRTDHLRESRLVTVDGFCSEIHETYCPVCDTVIHTTLRGGCAWNFVEETETGVTVHECDVCGAIMNREVSVSEKDENCGVSTVEVNTYIVNGEIVYSEKSSFYNEQHNNRYEFKLHGTSCEEGFTEYRVCDDCGFSSEAVYYSHKRYEIERVDLTAHGACSGEFLFRSCPCGEKAIVTVDGVCANLWTNNSYFDEELGRMVYVEVRSCEFCDLRISYTRYTEQKEGSCATTDFYTVLASMGDTLLGKGEYTQTGEEHDYDITAELLGGEGSSCEDGVRTTWKCTRCGDTFSNEIYDHEQTVKETIDLSRYGSVCGGTVVVYGCCCGRDNWISLHDCACDLGEEATELWIENALDGGQYGINGWEYYDSHAGLMICATTDPACSNVIRYAEYWLKDENDCYAKRYMTWQLGYDEATGECLYEVTVPTGLRRLCHNYVDESDGDGSERMTCSDCGSFYYQDVEYDEKGNEIRREVQISHTPDDDKARYRGEITEWTVDENGIYYPCREYSTSVWADGTESWREVLQETYADIPFGDWGMRTVSTGGIGADVQYEEIDITVDYEGVTFVLYHYRSEGDSWEQYENTYTFEGVCMRETVYTNSTGKTYTEKTECCEFFVGTTVKEPTCSQDGVIGYCCSLCGSVSDYETVPALDHAWAVHPDGYHYCHVCGLENENGVSGDVVMEDLTETFGGGESYVVGYCPFTDVSFSPYVSLVLPNGEELPLPKLEIMLLEGVRAYTFLMADVEAVASEMGVEDYEVRFALVPDGADGSFDYAITFGEPSAATGTVMGATSFNVYLSEAEEACYTICPTQDGIWTFTAFSYGDTFGSLFDADGGLLKKDDDEGVDNNFLITYELKAGEVYVIKLSWFYKHNYGTVNVLFTEGPVPVE